MNLPIIQNAELKNKIVLLRVDHNVVKKGIIKDPFRIDASLKTIQFILDHGGHPVIMSHVGRPRDKKTGKIEISEDSSVEPIVNYLEVTLNRKIEIPAITSRNDYGLTAIDFQTSLQKIRDGRIDCLYLPNTRWFRGEETGDENTIKLGLMLSEYCDLFVNDAFGSWQPHASTMEPAKHLPAYAGFLMQREIENLVKVLEPETPFLAIIAGAKFDTKIGPLKALLQRADQLIIGGVIYNAYLCAKYNIRIKGVSQEEVISAQAFLDSIGELQTKIIELPFIVESELPDKQEAGKFKTINLNEIKTGMQLNYVLDAGVESFTDPLVKKVIQEARTIFVNAVMGFTPHFTAGTTQMYSELVKNKTAMLMFGGGDTLQEFKSLLPEDYKSSLKSAKRYFFTGGGTILKVIQGGSPYDLEPVKALIKGQKS